MNVIAKPEQMIYQPVTRGNIGVLIMLAGGSGTGKTNSALRLAKGLAGPEGIICLADTDNRRAAFFAGQFNFKHLSLTEPFRPQKFEAAAIAAQQQNAAVWICDNFSHEHSGPGGLLEFHQEVLGGMVERAMKRDDRLNEFDARDRFKAAAWIEPKGEHKHMLQRFWQLNMHVILCCQAEKKIAMEKITSGPKKGKTDFVDQGYQPICGPDIPYAMTCAFMLYVDKPGIPVVIKPMMPDLAAVIPLDRQLDEVTGAAIAAWARGDKAPDPEPAPARKAPATPVASVESKPEPAKVEIPPAQGGELDMDEQRIEDGARKLADKFVSVKSRQEHLALVDNKDNRKQIDWLRRNRKELFAEVNAALKASWKRTEEQAPSDQDAMKV